MPRKARKRSNTGIYHIMIRGINRQTIFEDDEDYVYFINVMKRAKIKGEFKLFGYCVMGNHVHILMQEKEESVSLSMQRICSSFVYWYNWKYDRCGHLFQERYKSETVENEAYLLAALRYIHQNPVKAGIVDNLDRYNWSSYHDYTYEKSDLDTELILGMFSKNKQFAIKKIKSFMEEASDEGFIEYKEKHKHKVSDQEIIGIVKSTYGVENTSVDLLEKDKKNLILRYLKTIDGVSIRQIARVTGVKKNIVERA
ncbi:MAG: transposase [Peptostreptococcaceae bacterium]|nr:transposase [Peptostreptococcaceae bacterium]